MKLYIAAPGVALLPVVLVSSYNIGYMGGFNYYGRPDGACVSPGRVQEDGSSCATGPRGSSWQAKQQQQQKEWVDRAFEQLESEFNNGTPNRRRRAKEHREDVVNNRDDKEDEGLRQQQQQQQQQEYLRKQQEWVNRAFALATEVASEIASSSSGRDVKEEEAKNEAVRQQHEDVVHNRDDKEDEGLRQQQQQQQEDLRKQQEWVNRAFGLATEVASEMASSSSRGRDAKEEAKNEAVRQQQQQQEWLNQAFGFATDVASGLSSPRYEVNEGKDAFQVALDVPGVKASDIDISFNEDDSVLKVSGKRDIIGEGGGFGGGGAAGGESTRTIKFSKSFSLDSSVVDKDKISAQINNGVLLVTVPKSPLEPSKKKVRKIIVVEVGPENNVPLQGPAGSTMSDEPSPENN
jgi:HSP20 family protein